MSITYGPKQPACDQVHAEKYRMPGEDFRSAMTRIASALSDNDEHFVACRDILLNQRFMPGGRIQAAMGATKITTPYNCFVSGIIEDSFVDGSGSIMNRAAQAASTMRLGGGIGYDFSTLRPRGELIRKLQSTSSGPISFMDIFDAVGRATASSGHRRGAQMGVLRVDHPDIEEFIRAKQNNFRLTGFNISIAITDAFMNAVEADQEFPLSWKGRIYRTIWARVLWDSIMRSTYDYAEPGILFVDQINSMNNLHYCETLAATNPCGEQPLPPHGACLLGSFNLVKYLVRAGLTSPWKFDYTSFFNDIPPVVRMMDNVVDRARYPLFEQEKEAQSKRRMGLGVTGLANAVEAQGYPYGTVSFLAATAAILGGLRNSCYEASSFLAKEKGTFPLYDGEHLLQSGFAQTLPSQLRETIRENGLRNSHLLSIAPTGTISLSADNVSSGIEPVFAHRVFRTVNSAAGPKVVELDDYGVRYLDTKGKTCEEVSIKEHIAVLSVATKYVDSAVSKTCNVPENISWESFKDTYVQAWKNGCKGCTTYRKGGKREGILRNDDSNDNPNTISDPMPVRLTEDISCEIDPASGRRNCE